jgi:AcrR family transcriptional regulator
MSPKTDISAGRKQQIFQAALACFNQKGYYQTTMDDIVAESGLSKGTLYWYFASKKELFVSLLQETLDPFGREWEAIVEDQSMTATQKLKASLTFFRIQIVEQVDLFGLVIESWAQTYHDDDVQKLTREFYKPYLTYMDRILNEGISEGEFQIEDVQATSAVILTIFDGLTLASGAGILDYDPNRLVDAAEVLVTRGLGVEV